MKQKVSKIFGLELVLDMHGCDVSKFTREDIARYLVELCRLIEMVRVFEPFFWDATNDKDYYPPHLRSVSVLQFIRTSDVRGHFMLETANAYINIFSCKKFDAQKAEDFTRQFFEAKTATSKVLTRV